MLRYLGIRLMRIPNRVINNSSPKLQRKGQNNTPKQSMSWNVALTPRTHHPKQNHKFDRP